MKTYKIICVWAEVNPNKKKSGPEAGSVHNRSRSLDRTYRPMNRITHRPTNWIIHRPYQSSFRLDRTSKIKSCVVLGFRNYSLMSIPKWAKTFLCQILRRLSNFSTINIREALAKTQLKETLNLSFQCDKHASCQMKIISLLMNECLRSY